jgi:hypothetical protein
MARRNLADPNFEPSDEDFRELLHHAGEDARAANAAAEKALRERIQTLRRRAIDEAGDADVQP